MDYTFIHFSTLSDNRAGHLEREHVRPRWASTPSKLPRDCRAVGVVGEVTADGGCANLAWPRHAHRRGCGDTAANALGAGIVRPGHVV
jgi:hypothetical protein